MRFRALTLTIALLAAPGAALLAQEGKPAETPAPPPKTVNGVTFTPIAAWKEEQSESSMRAAQYRLAKAEGDAEDASLVVYYFNGQGGTVEDNVDRWCKQFQRADGKPAKEAARIERREHDGLTITEVEVDGTFVAEMRPGGGERVNKPGQRLLGAIIVTPKAGPFFVKLVGPDKTVLAAKEDFKKFEDSFHQG